MPKNHTYNKLEKLKSKKLLEQLFAKGKSFLIFPLKIIYLPVNEQLDFNVKIGVGTSGKFFKKAVHRNRIKRVLREQYRLNKQPLHQAVKDKQLQVAVFILYIDKVLPDKFSVQQKMPMVIEKLCKIL